MINFIINSHDLPIEYIKDFNGLFLLFYVLGRQSVHSNGIVLEIPANNLWL